MNWNPWRDVAKRPNVRIVAAALVLLTGLEAYHFLGTSSGLLRWWPSRPPVSLPSSPLRSGASKVPPLTGTATSPDWSDNEDVIVRGLRAWRERAEVVAEIGVEMKLLADPEEQRRNVHFVIAPDSTLNLIFADGTARAVPVIRLQGAPTVAEVFRPRQSGEPALAVWPATWPAGTQLSSAGVNVIRLWGAVPAELQAAPPARVQVSVRALTRTAIREFEKAGTTIPMARLMRLVAPFVVEPKLDEGRPSIAAPPSEPLLPDNPPR